ncbi:hypothetical protein T552_01217 [Pneumocystis carinii B80]|uniref:Small-subunit processome Utp12 domain-containing protein n=1 Tax=Pneumocystis carinii (strain B80) TaxID=1408658 RepID=A0A0W4ZLL2_PNEC8|nr:hypothetical protein T552_01217 [Pneumocystis carinii B80]KTW29262.1 hypothetical protein T552_01217 [Pneumocystis carinii B80]
MVKSYENYEFGFSWGVITSYQSNSILVDDKEINERFKVKNGLAVVPALEDVIIWDIKKGEEVLRWSDFDCKSETTSIKRNLANKYMFGVGYEDGSIRLWTLEKKEFLMKLNGHRSSVTVLTFDITGTRLVSGSKDTDIIVWDVVSEAGMYRLRGHKDEVTECVFLRTPVNEVEFIEPIKDHGWIVSVSKDSFIKIWDLSTQHCVETHIAHHGECWALGVSCDQKICVTAGLDGELKIWCIQSDVLAIRSESVAETSYRLTLKCTLTRQSKERPITIAFHPVFDMFACHGADKIIEIYKKRDEKELKKLLSRRKKRNKEKHNDSNEDISLLPEDEIVLYTTIRTFSKIRSIDWGISGQNPIKKNVMQLLVSFSNNTIGIYDIPVVAKINHSEPLECLQTFSIEMHGHRSDIRSLSIDSNDEMLASVSNGTLKIWNIKTGRCIRSLECGYALCCSFCLENKYVIVGTKEGYLEIFDIPSSTMIERILAHKKSIWSLKIHPDGQGFVTGSSDKSVKFWDLKIIKDLSDEETMKLQIKEMRILNLTDDVLSVCFSPNGHLIAISLLDTTVKVFYVNTLKFFLSLYGHKLPVLSMDISSDSKLLVTSSADKNIKLWGLDFGDCHKSIFAHQDSVMQVAFEKKGHNFFSTGKDKLIKYWDGDKFENILKLEGHHSEIWALAVSNNNKFIITGSHDRSIRIWNQTEEPIFLQEQKEKELERFYERDLVEKMDKYEMNENKKIDELASAGKQTLESVMAGERIIDALDIGIKDIELMREYEEAKKNNDKLKIPTRNPIFVANENISAEDYVLNILEKVHSSHLEDALLVLPFKSVIYMLTFIDLWAEKGSNIQLICRILFNLLRVHHQQIIADKTIRFMLDSIRIKLRKELQVQKDMIGYNLAALKYIHQSWEIHHTKEFYNEEEYKKQLESGKKRVFSSLEL